jgi:hypothetical protein
LKRQKEKWRQKIQTTVSIFSFLTIQTHWHREDFFSFFLLKNFHVHDTLVSLTLPWLRGDHRGLVRFGFFLINAHKLFQLLREKITTRLCKIKIMFHLAHTCEIWWGNIQNLPHAVCNWKYNFILNFWSANE